MFVRRPDWVRADEVSADPKSGDDPAPTDYLPRLMDPVSGAYQDVVIARVEVIEIAHDSDNSFSSLEGQSFVVESDAEPRQIRVLTETLGTFQALLCP